MCYPARVGLVRLPGGRARGTALAEKHFTTRTGRHSKAEVGQNTAALRGNSVGPGPSSQGGWPAREAMDSNY